MCLLRIPSALMQLLYLYDRVNTDNASKYVLYYYICYPLDFTISAFTGESTIRRWCLLF